MSYPQHPQQAYPPGPPQQPYGYPPQGYDQQYNQGYVPPGVPQYGAPQGQQPYPTYPQQGQGQQGQDSNNNQNNQKDDKGCLMVWPRFAVASHAPNVVTAVSTVATCVAKVHDQ
ncbi:hypothetical protein N7445_008188 [Penicillium cf. griseofulvum]|nr:hypothetical protein N7445_008188 [Penicillium cf. griseofulvum]